MKTTELTDSDRMTSTIDENHNKVKDLLRTLGKTYLQRGQYQEAYDKFTQLLEMGHGGPDLLMDTSTAAIGVNDTSQAALEIYEKAVELNPNSEALLLGLATLFQQKNIRTPFSLDVGTKAAKMSSPHADKLKAFVETTDKNNEIAAQTPRTEEHQHRSAPESNNFQAIRHYVENLWWQCKFQEAFEFLHKAIDTNETNIMLEQELALTHAYEMFTNQQVVDNEEMLEDLFAGLEHTNQTNSLNDLRTYLTLRMALPEGFQPNHRPDDDFEEFRFILGLIPIDEYFGRLKHEPKTDNIHFGSFNLTEEVLNPLSQDRETQNESKSTLNWTSILAARVQNENDMEMPKQAMDLINTHLFNIPDSIIRRVGAGWLCLAIDPEKQISMTTELLQKLDEYNHSRARDEQVVLNCAVEICPNATKDGQTTLSELVQALHLLRLAQIRNAEHATSGLFFVKCEAETSENLTQLGVKWASLGQIDLLPGQQTSCSEIIWQDPLAQISKKRTVRLSDFDVQERLVGHLGYATFLGTDDRLDRNVILKVMSPEFAISYLRDRNQLDKLFEDIRRVATMSHPNIATLFDLGQQDRMIFIVREYLEGQPITQFEFPAENQEMEIISILLQILRALTFAQQRGISHLSLKPTNIWLNESGGVKITDFRIPGFASDFRPKEMLSHAHWRYLAPEILTGVPGDPRSDIYSLGIIAYELLAEQHPYGQVDQIDSVEDIFELPIAALEEKHSKHYQDWNRLLFSAMIDDPDKRPQELQEFQEGLRDIQVKLLDRQRADTAKS
ncbi:serine/threonine protein kinase [candidate division KSB1 bacterium]|nr:serine/threonine protein kinase [candidate division KSB1 bacterium]NIR70197.1 serine/threonine protein kinase [candidate division KSB1 bacterium]NIS27584.1 serine/threonine protein kinase [candidate division KSB1 bacterium]NIT74436.1 serine/threonine protein kinase [candidate division KSB1 bacterium]NIU28301.1 serine/threonine protein kinase [candidate division KSB1 bacterium]